MPSTPEERAREKIDDLLSQAGWVIQDMRELNVRAGLGVAVREFPLKQGHGFADYLLYIDGRIAGVIEAKPEGMLLKGVETQSSKYREGLQESLPSWGRPLPIAYESTGKVTQFTNYQEPDARSRFSFAFHTPEALQDLLQRGNLRSGLQSLPLLNEEKLWPAQIATIKNLEKSLKRGDPRALIQMATGSGKTFTACNFVYRLLKHAGARRILFLVDRANLGEQTESEFQGFNVAEENRKFTELYNVQQLKSNHINDSSKVVISTVQRLFSILKGDEEFAEELDEESLYERDLAGLGDEFAKVSYNPSLPINTFDVIIVDECHRSIYNVWRQVLDYFDAFIIGLTATPSKGTFGYFNQNLVNSYTHAEAVADGVNVGYDVYPIRTRITAQGSIVGTGEFIDTRDRKTGVREQTRLDDELQYGANQLDRDVVAEDQIRLVLQTFRDKLQSEIFPDRTQVPKTLVFAKNDRHAEDIVRICRDVFGKGNDFCRKITSKVRESKPKDLIQQFRNDPSFRIAVTVDMIATGTDIKPLECLLFMRTVKSQNYFEQMKGRGVRICSDTTMQSVNIDEGVQKVRFVIVDAVGVTEVNMGDSRPMIKKPSASMASLLKNVAMGNRDPELISTLAARLARLDRTLEDDQRESIAKAAGGTDLKTIVKGLIHALDDDKAEDQARENLLKSEPAITRPPTPEEVTKAKTERIAAAAKPIASNAPLRDTIETINTARFQKIDIVSQDELLSAGFSDEARDKLRATISDFRQFIEDNKEEIEALQILYSRPYHQRLRYEDLTDLLAKIAAPPRNWTTDKLWRAYQTLEASRVKGHGGKMVTDLVSLVRFALDQEPTLAPFSATVDERFQHWLAQQENAGRSFNSTQLEWLQLIRDHVAANLSVEVADFDANPSLRMRGGIGAFYNEFGDEYEAVLTDLNEALSA